LALAVRLARDKQRRFRVIATMRNVGRSGALAAAAGSALGRTLEIKQLDVCDEGSIRACLDGIPGRHIDVLVSNAGVGMVGPLECQSLAAMQSLMDTNFFGLVRLVKEVLPDMKRRRGGHIVVISSIMGLQDTLRVIEAARPPFRHQTNVAYTPMAALKHADPSGALMTDAFYKLVFKYDAVLRLSLRAIRLLRWKAQKVKEGARLLGFK
ncbi:PREDICTED: retinol dehydrogenase 8-like, partial [Haliaeetus leucocephalus]|uniref:retinol dehydrogenase 8-like n=1 Tax=Haliaeetus leucocephalus TaxID=52644 RepID=UPI00053CBA5A